MSSSSASVIASDNNSSVGTNSSAQQAGAANADANGSSLRNPAASPSPGTGASASGGQSNSDGQVVPMGGLPPAPAASPANVFWALNHGVGPSSRGNGNGNTALSWSVTSDSAAATSSQPLAPTATPPALAPSLAPSDAQFDPSIPSRDNMQSSSTTSTYLATPSPSRPGGSGGSGAGSGSGWWSGGDSNTWTAASSSTTPTATPIDLAAPTVSFTLSSSAPAPTFTPSPPGSQSGSLPSPTTAITGPSNGSAALDASNSGLPASALATLIAFPVSLALMFSAMVALIVIRRRHGAQFGMHTDRDLESGSSHRMPPALPTQPHARPPSVGRRDEHQHFLYRSGSAPLPPPRMSSVYHHQQPGPLRPPDAPAQFGATSSSSSSFSPSPIVTPPNRPQSPKGRAHPHHRQSIAIPASIPSNSPRVHNQPHSPHPHRLSILSPPKPYRSTPSPPSRPPTSHSSRSARPHPSIILNNLTASASVSEQAARRISGLGAIPRRPSSLSLSVISRADLECDGAGGSYGSDDGSDSDEYYQCVGGNRAVGDDRVSTFEFEQLATGAGDGRGGPPHGRKSSYFWFK